MHRSGRTVLIVAAAAFAVAASAVPAVPSLLAPRRPLPPAPDPLVANDAANRLRADMNGGGAEKTIRLTSEEATAFIIQALAAWRNSRHAVSDGGPDLPAAPEQVRVRFLPGKASLEGVARLEGADVLPFFRDRPVGVSLELVPDPGRERFRNPGKTYS